MTSPEPDPRDGSVLVEAISVGVCGTDVRSSTASTGWAPPGKARLVLGHESLGSSVMDPGPTWAASTPIRASRRRERVSARALHRRRRPRAVGDFLLRRVEPQRQLEHSILGRRQPVALLVLAGRVALDVERQTAVGIERQVTAVAERVAVDRIGDEIGIVVVHRQRPERIDRRDLGLGEMQGVLVRAVERLAVAVEFSERIDGVLRQVAADAEESPARTIGVLGAVAAHVERNLPAVDHLAARGLAHGLDPVGDAGLDRLAHLRCERVHAERRARRNAERRQTRHRLRIVRFRRVRHQQAIETVEEVLGRQRQHLFRHRRLGVHAFFERHVVRRGVLACPRIESGTNLYWSCSAWTAA